jgi:hypothetical protein
MALLRGMVRERERDTFQNGSIATGPSGSPRSAVEERLRLVQVASDGAVGATG